MNTERMSECVYRASYVHCLPSRTLAWIQTMGYQESHANVFFFSS